MSNWGIAHTAPEIEKIKAESADYLRGLNCCCLIDWNVYDRAFDFYMDLIDKAYAQGKKDAQPEIIHCRECKHRPKATRADEKVFYGFSVVFPDEKCPCYCVDGWYRWYPEDDFYCGYAERREE